MSNNTCPKCNYPEIPGKAYKGVYTLGERCAYCGHQESKLPDRAKASWQKKECMEKILAAWMMCPDLRLGQLLVNAAGHNDIFYDEDITLTQKVIDFGKNAERAAASHSQDKQNDKGDK